jgi:hypothetical protein
MPPASLQLALSVAFIILSAAAEPGGAELCSLAPMDVSLLVPAVDPPDMSFLASDPGGAELCSFAPVEVSAPPAAGVCESSAARAALAHRCGNSRDSKVTGHWTFPLTTYVDTRRGVFRVETTVRRTKQSRLK